MYKYGSKKIEGRKDYAKIDIVAYMACYASYKIYQNIPLQNYINTQSKYMQVYFSCTIIYICVILNLKLFKGRGVGTMANRELTPIQKRECDQVRMYRAEADMIQSEFAKAIGVSLPTLKNIESYKTPVTKKTKSLISSYLKNSGKNSGWYDMEDDADVDLDTAIRQLIHDKSRYVMDIVDCVDAIVSTKSFKEPIQREQYIEFVSATIKSYKNICETEARAIRRNEDNDLKQEVESFNSAVKRTARHIYDVNNKKK